MKQQSITRSAGRCFPALLVGIAGLNPVLTPGAARAQQQPEQRRGRPQAVAVEVVKPSRQPMVRTLKMPATLRADEQVDLLAKVSGYVAEVQVDIGDRVREGDLLVTLSVPEMADELGRMEATLQAQQARVRALEAKVLQARRAVDTARAEVQRHAAQHALDEISLQRKKELYRGKAIPEQALDEARSAHAVTEAQLQIAHAQVAGAEAQQQAVQADVQVAEAELLVGQARLARLRTLMEYASIKAPFDGVITERHIDRGAFVRSAVEGAAAPLLHLAKTDRIRIVLDLPESDAGYVRVGTRVEIDVKASPRRPFSATVSRTAGALRPQTRTMRVEIDIDNADSRFAPGMYAQVAVTLESKAQALVIPSKAIRVQGRETVVFVSVGGVAEARPVRVGYDDGIRAEILSGLDEGALVITSTSGVVAPGVPVSPVFSDS